LNPTILILCLTNLAIMTFEGVMPVTEVMGYRPNNNNGANFEGIKPVTGEITGYRTSNNVVVVHSKVERMKEVVRDVEGLVNEETKLPCNNVRFEFGEDRAKLIMWFRNGSETPFYIYDAVKDSQPVKEWRDEEILVSSRSKFDGSHLIISETEISDEGSYRCRVDYIHGQTTFDSNHLTVITLPHQPSIVISKTGETRDGHSLDTWLQVVENSSLQLECRCHGGHPRPRLTWWIDSHLLDDSYQIEDDMTSNILRLSSVNRTLVNKVITCEASNTDLSLPLHTSLQLDLVLAPVEVTISSPTNSMILGQELTLTCTVVGARPIPNIVWEGDYKTALEVQYKVWGTTSQAVSQVIVRPETKTPIYNYGCFADTPSLNSSLYNTTSLNVHYVPDVALKIGASLNKSNIRENSDVYFECLINSNPPVTSVSWHHNNRKVFQDKDKGIIISGNSLALQKIQRENAGDYFCTGSNTIGSNQSSSLHLDVKYPPTCKSTTHVLYTVSLNTSVKLECGMEANPGTNIKFRWSGNTTIITRQMDAMMTSRIIYTPRLETHYGSLYCHGYTSSVGSGAPCVYIILPPGLSLQTPDCFATNITHSSFQVHCDDTHTDPDKNSANSNDNKEYLIEVSQVSNDDNKLEKHSSGGILFNNFSANNLDPNTRYIVTIRRRSGEQLSEAQILFVDTLVLPSEMVAESVVNNIQSNSFDSDSSNVEYSFQILVALSLVVLTILFVILIVLGLRHRIQTSTNQTTRIQHLAHVAHGTPDQGYSCDTLCLPDTQLGHGQYGGQPSVVSIDNTEVSEAANLLQMPVTSLTSHTMLGMGVMDNEDEGFSQKLKVLKNKINLQDVKESVI